MTFPRFALRARQREWMDDLSATGSSLTDALDDLRAVNTWLGGYKATLDAIGPYLKAHAAGRTVRIVDIGAGVADYAEQIILWANRQSPPLSVEITATDLNAATVDHARRRLAERAPKRLGSRIHIEVADALNLPYAANEFDLAMTAMVLHHLNNNDALTVLRGMDRVARDGIVINDLHRHPLAYWGFQALSRFARASPMVRHDGPLSVLRAFRRDELARLATLAGLHNPRLQWCWAFRWVLSTVH